MLTVLVVVTHVGLLVGAAEASRLNGLFGDLDVLLVGRPGSASVDGVFVDLDMLGLVLRPRRGVYGGVILGAVTLSVFTLSDVNGVCVRVTVSIDLNVSVGELGGACRSKGSEDGCQLVCSCWAR